MKIDTTKLNELRARYQATRARLGAFNRYLAEEPDRLSNYSFRSAVFSSLNHQRGDLSREIKSVVNQLKENKLRREQGLLKK